jgi:hypothetical protein
MRFLDDIDVLVVGFLEESRDNIMQSKALLY